MKLSLTFILFLLHSCATSPYRPYAREVLKKPKESGTIALKLEYVTEDHKKAEELMLSNCGPEKTIDVVEEGEVAVGEKTQSSSQKNQENQQEGFSFGGIKFSGLNNNDQNSGQREKTDTVSEKILVKEWQIRYQCLGTRTAKNTKK